MTGDSAAPARPLSAAVPAAEVPASEDSAVRALYDAISNAWANGDANSFAAWYAEDATVILPGNFLRGRAGVLDSMAAAFAGPLTGSRRFHAVHSMRSPGPGLAIVITRSATVFPGQSGPEPDRQELVTWLLSRHDGRWLVEAYHSCPEHAG